MLFKTNLERKKRQLELDRVKLAKKEIEFKIEERLEDVERLKEHVKIQDLKIQEIEDELKQ